jgi:hypothetical protein
MNDELRERRTEELHRELVNLLDDERDLYPFCARFASAESERDELRAECERLRELAPPPFPPRWTSAMERIEVLERAVLLIGEYEGHCICGAEPTQIHDDECPLGDIATELAARKPK